MKDSSSKYIIKKVKKQARELEKIFSIHISETVCVPRMNSQLQINHKKKIKFSKKSLPRLE